MKAQLDQPKIPSTGHSSDVEILLHCATVTFPVLQASEHEIKLNRSDNVPQGDAILETIVDGHSHRWPIRVLGQSQRPKWIAIADR